MPCSRGSWEAAVGLVTVVGGISADNLGEWTEYPNEIWEEVSRANSTAEARNGVLAWDPAPGRSGDPNFLARTRVAVDLSEAPFYARVRTPVAGSGTRRAQVSLGRSNETPFAAVSVAGSTITYEIDWGNGATGETSEAYSQGNQDWWRIRWDDGDAVLEVASCSGWVEKLRVDTVQGEGPGNVCTALPLSWSAGELENWDVRQFFGSPASEPWPLSTSSGRLIIGEPIVAEIQQTLDALYREPDYLVDLTTCYPVFTGRAPVLQNDTRTDGQAGYAFFDGENLILNVQWRVEDSEGGDLWRLEAFAGVQSPFYSSDVEANVLRQIRVRVVGGLLYVDDSTDGGATWDEGFVDAVNLSGDGSDIAIRPYWGTTNAYPELVWIRDGELSPVTFESGDVCAAQDVSWSAGEVSANWDLYGTFATSYDDGRLIIGVPDPPPWELETGSSILGLEREGFPDFSVCRLEFGVQIPGFEIIQTGQLDYIAAGWEFADGDAYFYGAGVAQDDTGYFLFAYGVEDDVGLPRVERPGEVRFRMTLDLENGDLLWEYNEGSGWATIYTESPNVTVPTLNARGLAIAQRGESWFSDGYLTGLTFTPKDTPLDPVPPVNRLYLGQSFTGSPSFVEGERGGWFGAPNPRRFSTAVGLVTQVGSPDPPPPMWESTLGLITRAGRD